MPLYDYKCEKCEYIFEELVSVHDKTAELLECPKCGKKLAHKLPSRFAISKNQPERYINVKPTSVVKKRGAFLNIANGNAQNVNIHDITISGDPDRPFLKVHPDATVNVTNCKREP